VGDIAIEVKRARTPDWCQVTLHRVDGHWLARSGGGRQPLGVATLFNSLVADTVLFNGRIPPFLLNNITHDEWLQIKAGTNDFNDSYIQCPPDTIRKMYELKGCAYIQVESLGVFRVADEDVCSLDVPLFECPQRLRVRTKVHHRVTKSGYCSLSVTIACQPVDFKSITPSPYSIDDLHGCLPEIFEKFPKNDLLTTCIPNK